MGLFQKIFGTHSEHEFEKNLSDRRCNWGPGAGDAAAVRQ